MDCYDDDFGPEVRKKLQDSKYNLCCMCLISISKNKYHADKYNGYCTPRPLDYYYLRTIKEMEKELDYAYQRQGGYSDAQ